MKVLMQSRKNFYTMPGGDTIQLLKTKEELEKLGVEVDISLELTPELSKYDLVHLSNVTRIQETYIQMQNAKNQGKPVALSTIFWPMDEFEKNGQIGLRKLINNKLEIDQIEKIKAIARFIKDTNSRNIATKNLIKIGYTTMQKFVIKNADIFLPNSEIEMEKLCEKFEIKTKKYIVVPNAIDLNYANKDFLDEELKEFSKYENAIICVGRIETRKNQLALLKALNNTEYKVILVGAASPNHKKYFKEIKEIIDKNERFFYIPKIENEELYKLYKVCKVSILPSWLDTPGLVSLEAGAMGCNLVVSTRGSTREYFGDYAFYCEPDDIDSIRKAVKEAYEANKNDELEKMIKEKYNWKTAAERTYMAYKLLLERKQ